MNIVSWYVRALAAAFAMMGAMAARPAVAQLNIAAEARVTLLARAYNAAGQQLFGQLGAAPGNVVFSPYSVGTALSMALSGARGDTASEMMRALSMRMAADAIDAANAEMLSILNGYDQGSSPPACPPQASASGGGCEARPESRPETRPDSRPGGQMMNQCPPGQRLVGNRCVDPGRTKAQAKILAANAAMLHQRGDLISADYMAAVKNKYAAEIFRNAGLDDVNGWVARKTEGRIPHLVDAIDLDAAAATLLNAIYFKARWASVFDAGGTSNDAFNLTRAQKADVPFMHQTERFSLVTRGGYRALRLNYEVRELGLVIVLPDDIEGAGAVTRRLGANELSELFAALRDGQAKKPVALALPKFKIEFKAGLIPPLQQAGIRKAFDKEAADFSGMTGRGPPAGDERIYIGDVVHRAVIDVAEEGTEAAAATAVIAPAGALIERNPPPPPEAFRADHPFLFYLVDDTTGAILFQGRVADPRG